MSAADWVSMMQNSPWANATGHTRFDGPLRNGQWRLSPRVIRSRQHRHFQVATRKYRARRGR